MGKGSAYKYDSALEGRDVCRTLRVPFLPLKPTKFAREMGYLRPLSGSDGLVPILLSRAMDLLKEESFSIILATSGPLESLNVACRLSAITGYPWIADLRDISMEHGLRCQWTRPWAWRSWPYKAWEAHQEASICRKANAVITVSPPLADTLHKRGVPNVQVIFNGFDDSDYTQKTVGDTKVFQVVYAGVMQSGCNPNPLFDALDLLLSKGSIHLDDFNVIFYGPLKNQIEPCIHGRLCKPLVTLGGWSPREQMHRIMSESSILLQLSYPKVKGIITSKIFEYLGAARPILSIPRDNGVIDSLLNETGAGLSADTPREIADIILEFYRQWKEKGRAAYLGNPEAIFRYTRKAQAKKLAKILQEILNDSRVRI